MLSLLRLAPLLIALALLAGVPSAVSGQEAYTVGFTQPVISVTEGIDTEAQVTIQISPAPSSAVQVIVSTQDGTATAPEHYTALAETIEFSSTVTSHTISIDIVANTVLDFPEAFP